MGVLGLGWRATPTRKAAYLTSIRLPIEGGLVLKARETWPRATRVFCTQDVTSWDESADLIDDVPVLLCQRRGPRSTSCSTGQLCLAPSSSSPRRGGAQRSGGRRRRPPKPPTLGPESPAGGQLER